MEVANHLVDQSTNLQGFDGVGLDIRRRGGSSRGTPFPRYYSRGMVVSWPTEDTGLTVSAVGVLGEGPLSAQNELEVPSWSGCISRISSLDWLGSKVAP